MCSNTELAIKIKGLETQLDGLMQLNAQSAAFQKEKLNAILEQAIKTETRISVCENTLSKLKIWIWFMEKPKRIIWGLVGLATITNLERLIEFLLKHLK